MKTIGSFLCLAFFVLSCDSSEGTPAAGAAGTCDPLAFAMLNTARSDAKVCAATTACIGSKCAEAAQECAGPDYKAQSYTGTCGTYLDCVKGCRCAKDCVDACDPGTLDCATCLSVKLGLGCVLTCASEIASCGK